MTSKFGSTPLSPDDRDVREEYDSCTAQWTFNALQGAPLTRSQHNGEFLSLPDHPLPTGVARPLPMGSRIPASPLQRSAKLSTGLGANPFAKSNKIQREEPLTAQSCFGFSQPTEEALYRESMAQATLSIPGGAAEVTVDTEVFSALVKEKVDPLEALQYSRKDSSSPVSSVKGGVIPDYPRYPSVTPTPQFALGRQSVPHFMQQFPREALPVQPSAVLPQFPPRMYNSSMIGLPFKRKLFSFSEGRIMGSL